jgi:fructokinase
LCKLFVYLCSVFELRGQQDKNDKRSMTDLVDAIFEIAKKNPEGFTVEVPSLKPVTSGYIAACKETQSCFGKQGLKR